MNEKLIINRRLLVYRVGDKSAISGENEIHLEGY